MIQDLKPYPEYKDSGQPWLGKVPDAWIDHSKTQIGYEISFTRHFYKPQALRSLDEIKADILALERESEGLLEQIIGETG